MEFSDPTEQPFGNVLLYGGPKQGNLFIEQNFSWTEPKRLRVPDASAASLSRSMTAIHKRESMRLHRLKEATT